MKAYAEKAQEYSQDWLSQPVPNDMYEVLKKYFIAGGKTADLGCGNGRDAQWLQQNGYPTTGYDASLELIQLGASLYPKVAFQQAFLPELSEIKTQFENVLCETVIMHLPKDQLLLAIQNIRRIVKLNGVLYLSWRVTEKEDARHQDGRLYSAFDPQVVLSAFSGDQTLHFEDVTSASSGKRICRLIVRL